MPQHIKITVTRKTLFEDSFQQVKIQSHTDHWTPERFTFTLIPLFAILKMCLTCCFSALIQVSLFVEGCEWIGMLCAWSEDERDTQGDHSLHIAVKCLAEEI